MQKFRQFLFLTIIACLLAACNHSGSDPIISETAMQDFSVQATQETTPTSLPTATPTPIHISHVEKGDQAFFNGDWDAAINEYMNVWRTDPDLDIQAAALLGLGRTYYETAEYAAALDTLRRLKESYPDSPRLPETYFTLARVYEALDRFSEAADAYQAYLDFRPGVIDSYVHEWRGDALTATGAYTMAINAYQDAIRAPRLDEVMPLEIKIGNSYYNLGDYQTALVVYSDIYTRTNNDYTKASMNFMTGLSHIQLGQSQEGYQAYLDSVENYPLSYDTYLGLINLVDAGYPVNEFDRGIVDYFAGQYSLAISAFDRYLLNPGEYAGTALYYEGLAYRAIDNPTAAINSWDQLIQNYPEDEAWSDAWEQKGYTQWAFLGQYEKARETFLQFVNNNPYNPRAAEFLFFAGQVAERAGELEAAAEIWMRIASEYPQSNLLPRAFFLSGINHYRRGDFGMALDTFQQAVNYPGDRSALNFWIGKTYQAMGEPAAAEISWRETVGIDPTGYYSERARDILLGREAFSAPLMYDLGYDPVREKDEAEQWMREVFAIPDGMDISNPGSLVNDLRWIRGTELWNLGLYEEAKAEFEDLRSEISVSPMDSYRLANYLVELGMYRPAIFAARQVLNLNDMDDADTMNAPTYFNHIRFGGYYKELVIPIAEAYDMHPLFLFSVMRQESLFEGFVRSAAGARGLMQIMPVTGDSIAANAGWPPGYTSEDLYRPKVSLTFGANYLDSQRDYFDGQLYPALAAYNAGPGNASIWWELSGGDPDLFLEIIRYEETRDYIRGIYEVFSIYRRLYDRTP